MKPEKLDPIMVRFPQVLLERLDREVERRRQRGQVTSRAALVRRLVEEGLPRLERES